MIIKNEYLKDFNGWNEKKKAIDTRTSELIYYPKIGEVCKVSYGNNIGWEENSGGLLLERTDSTKLKSKDQPCGWPISDPFGALCLKYIKI